jgi:hypothetical protein
VPALVFNLDEATRIRSGRAIENDIDLSHCCLPLPVGLVRLDIADASIVILELALNEEIGLQWCGQIKVRARVLRVERDLEVLIGEVVDRHVGCV